MDDVSVARPTGLVEGGGTGIVVSYPGAGSVLEEEADDIRVAIVTGTVKGCVAIVSPLLVDIRPGFDESADSDKVIFIRGFEKFLFQLSCVFCFLAVTFLPIIFFPGRVSRRMP